MYYQYFKKGNYMRRMDGAYFDCEKRNNFIDLVYYKEKDFDIVDEVIYGKEYDWAFLKKKVIGRYSEPLLIRWSLIETPFFGIKIHKFCKSDHDCLHDHPWNFISIILKGGYLEVTEDCNERIWLWKKPGTILYRRAEHRHSVQLEYANGVTYPAWTLVITFRKRRSWGFWNSLDKFFHYKNFKESEHKC